MILKIEAHFHNGTMDIVVDVPSHDPLYWRRPRPWAKTSSPTARPENASTALSLAVLHLYRALQLADSALESPAGDES